MKYEYNGNLLEEDRINLVAKEIITKYPQINLNQAKEIAMLEGKISTDCNLDIMFNRLYNIMLVMNNDINLVKTIYSDLINILKNNQNDAKIDYYYNVTLEINNFLKKERDFPYLDEF